MEYAKLYWACALLAGWGDAAPGGRIVFPDDAQRQERRVQEEITPPVLPVLPHLENDPSTRLPGESRNSRPASPESGLKPRFGLSHGFDVSPNADGGVTASFSHGFSGAGGHSQSAAHSFSLGFANGFQASQSASQSASFGNNGFLGSSFAGSQASSQSSSFAAGANGISSSSSSTAAAASSASSGNGLSSAHSQSAGFGATFGGNSAAASQSASSAFSGGNGQQGNGQQGNNFGEGALDIRHRAGSGRRGVATSIVFPGETSQRDRARTQQLNFGDNRWRGGSSSYRSNDGGDWLAILVSD